jgi:hypothetical protein
LGASKTEINRVQLALLKYSEEFEESDYQGTVYDISKFQAKPLPDSAINVLNLSDDDPIKHYAAQRGILGLYDLYCIPDIIHKHRLIIPFLYEGNIVGWTGRHTNPPNKKTPKYLHENLPPNFVFNVDRFINKHREIVVVTEGFIDAILIDGVAVLSNEMSAEQAHLISKLAPRVIVCPDRDRAGKTLIAQAIELGWEVSFPPWNKQCKDAADACTHYGRLATLASIIKHSTNNATLIKVKTKML